MYKVRHNNASDEKGVRCSEKIPGMQTCISIAKASEKERLKKIAKRNKILKYATERLKDGENLKNVLTKSKIYAEMLKVDTKSITEATMKMLQKKIQNQDNEMDNDLER